VSVSSHQARGGECVRARKRERERERLGRGRREKERVWERVVELKIGFLK